VYGGQSSLLTNGVDCRYPQSAFTLLHSLHLYDFCLFRSRLTVPTSAEVVWLEEVVVWPVVVSVVIALQM